MFVDTAHVSFLGETMTWNEVMISAHLFSQPWTHSVVPKTPPHTNMWPQKSVGEEESLPQTFSQFQMQLIVLGKCIN